MNSNIELINSNIEKYNSLIIHLNNRTQKVIMDAINEIKLILNVEFKLNEGNLRKSLLVLKISAFLENTIEEVVRNRYINTDSTAAILFSELKHTKLNSFKVSVLRSYIKMLDDDKSDLFKSVLKVKLNPTFEQSLDSLNTARNEIAHNSQYDRMDHFNNLETAGIINTMFIGIRLIIFFDSLICDKNLLEICKQLEITPSPKVIDLYS